MSTHPASSHIRSNPTPSGAGGTGSKPGTGTSDSGAKGGGRSPHTASHPSGGPTHDPTFSSQQIDQGASAVSHAVTHIGEVFAGALPTAPLEKLGTRLAAHAGLIPERGGKAQRQAVDRLGTTLGAALIGSAVAVERAPAAPSRLPIPFFEPQAPKPATPYIMLIAALLLAVGALVFREVRSALGLAGRRTGLPVAGEKPRIATGERASAALNRVRHTAERGSLTFRRLRANAISGVRSLF